MVPNFLYSILMLVCIHAVQEEEITPYQEAMVYHRLSKKIFKLQYFYMQVIMSKMQMHMLAGALNVSIYINCSVCVSYFRCESGLVQY